MSMWKTGVSFHSFSLFLFEGFSLFLGVSIIVQEPSVCWLLGRPCCEQNNWSFIQPSRRLILSFSLRKGNEKKKRKKKTVETSKSQVTDTHTTGRSVIFPSPSIRLRFSSCFVFFYIFCCTLLLLLWDVMEFQMSLGNISDSAEYWFHIPADTHTATTTIITTAATTTTDFPYSSSSCFVLQFAIRFDRWNIKRAVYRPPVGIWSASSCRASWAVAFLLLRLNTSRSVYFLR